MARSPKLRGSGFFLCALWYLVGVRFKSLGQSRRLVCSWLVASRAGRTGCAASASVGPFPRLILVNLAHPSRSLRKEGTSFRFNNVNAIWLFILDHLAGPKRILSSRRPWSRHFTACGGHSWLCAARQPGRRAGQSGSGYNLGRFERALEPQFDRLLRFRQCKKIRRN